ncbi:KAP family P-loop NTPase fold protein [Photobacterium leiognathi subsp. mandapamensis]|uniref:KAP family P-loop NTPase fold protein n=1 Tax=Photobacterium leiognathi TaxID=553611 RepID=UPI003AF3A50A
MDKFVEENEVFEKYSIIKREQYADFLTNFLNQQAENGYVLNLNAEWGAGKTTFLKCWYNKLKANHPVVYFDAWKTDFTHDAMTALMDSFHAQLANPISDNKALIRDFYEKGMHFIKIAVPSLAVGYLKHKSGMQNDESLLQDITDTFGINVTEDSCSDALKETLKAALEQRKKVEGIHEFKTALENIADEYIKVSNKHIPIYIFIDELDRCRPNYAIEVIENVKHFFNTKNFVFVIATDTKQLQHSIKAIYGYEFDSNLYLSRFFDYKITLPRPNISEYILNYKSIFKKKKDIKLNNNELANIYSTIFEFHGVNSLRDIEKILNTLELYNNCSDIEFKTLPLLTLLVLKTFHPEHYEEFKNKNLNPYSKNSEFISKIMANKINTYTSMNNIEIVTQSFLYYCLQELDSNLIGKPQTEIQPHDNSMKNEIKEFLKLIHNQTINSYNNKALLIDYINLTDLSFITDQDKYGFENI